MCLDRLVPPRKDRAVLFALPPIVDTADLPRATGTILHALAAGDLSPAEAADISKSVDAPVCATEATDLHAWKRASSAWRPVPRIGRLSRLSREEIVARVGDIFGRLIAPDGEHAAVASALAAIDPAAAHRPNARHQAGALRP